IGIPATILLVCGGAIYGSIYWYRLFGPQPPTISREGLEPAVADAIDSARQSVLNHARSGNEWGHLGKVFLAHKFPEEARVCFVQAETLEPNEPRWPYYQGFILALTDNASSTAKYRRVADLSGHHADCARLKLAEGLIEHGDWDRAKEQFDLLRQDNF